MICARTVSWLAIVLPLGCGGASNTSPGGDETTTSGPSVSATGTVADGSATTEGADSTGEATTGTSAACEARAAVVPTTGFFTDISDASGIRVDNFAEDPPPGVAINDHSRLAFVDLDADGFDDLVAHSLFPNPANGVPFEHLVFRNRGDGTFEDVSDASGLRDVQAGFFAFADVDNDGDQDAFAGLDLVGYASYRSSLWLNDGAGHFTVLADSGVEGTVEPTAAANAVFGDFDGDANVDLFVGMGGTTAAVPDQLFRGSGDGHFEAVAAALPGNAAHPSNGSVICDLDDDLDPDIFVSTYSVSTLGGHNVLWRNDGTGVFEDIAEAAGFAYQVTGNSWLASTGNGTSPEPKPPLGVYRGSNGFGIDCGDVDNDGDLDVPLTTISHPVDADYDRKWSDPSHLLINSGGGAGAEITFGNEWQMRGLPFNEGDIDGALVDFDNDGRLDISLSRESKYEDGYADIEQHGWFGLMHQQEDGTFVSVGAVSGINDSTAAFLRMKGAQNHAWSDIDHDGDLDLLVGGRDQGGGRPNFLFRNEAGDDNRWLVVRVTGDGVNVDRDAFGTRVTLRSDGGQRVREKKSSRGTYNSEDTRALHFGLGDLPCESLKLVVRWRDGTEVVFDGTEFGDDTFVDITYPDSLTVSPGG
jgi:hypothetical protein